MRLVLPPTHEAIEKVFMAPTSSSFMLGWQALLAGHQNTINIAKKALIRCPHCQENHIRLPEGVQGTLVGKASIKEGKELRKLDIQTPWTKEEAERFGHDAVKAWNQENDSPPLDKPPQATSQQQKALEEMCDLIPFSGADFEPQAWENIALTFIPS